jgi:UDP-N-acetylmuramyl pentapeptide synthase
MRAGLDVLLHTAKTRNLRPVAVLGDMRELGSISEQAHKTVGAYAAQVGIRKLVTFGKAASNIAKGAKEAGMSEENILTIEDTENAENAARCLKTLLKEGDAILFKASRAVALERLIRLI